jgi:hypothetical protein
MYATLLSDAPYLGAPYSEFYIIKDKRTKKILFQDKYCHEREIPLDLGIHLWFHLVDGIRENPAPEGRHYDIFRRDDRIRIGVQAFNVDFGFYDLPNI